MCFRVITILVLLSTWTAAQRMGQGGTKSLNQVLAWKVLEYGFPTDNDRQYAIDNGLLTEHTGTPIDVAVQYSKKMRVFVTIPRFTAGIPYTLATVSSQNGPNGPIIQPYPTYEWHNKNNAQCTSITSAFRVAIDECNHMWVIDSGMVANVQVCPPQLLIFNLDTDTLIHRYQFTTDVYTPTASLLINPIVDIHDPPPTGRCQKAMVYIADVTDPGLVVYSSERNVAWRVENKWMHPDPDWGTHTIAGESFELMDGMFAINLTPRNKRGGAGSGERYLYFHAMASDTECSVPLRLIDNQTIWQGNTQAYSSAFRPIGKRGVQSPMEAMDSKGNLFANTHDLTIFAWNIYSSPYTFNSFKIVANNRDQLQFASGMKVVKNPNTGHEELWVSTCRFQKIAAGTQDVNEINFRILACKIDDLLANRGCSSLGGPAPSANSLYSNLVFN